MTDKVQKIREELKRLREQLQNKVEESDFISGEVFIINYFLTFIDSLQEKPNAKFKVGQTITDPTDSTFTFHINKIEDGRYIEKEDEWVLVKEADANYELVEEPVSKPIDFEKELYKAFGQVKDFTLGMRIAKWFYDIGKNSQEPLSEDLEEAAKVYEQTRNDLDVVSDNQMVERAFQSGAKWQKAKDEYITKDLGEYISELSKQFPEVSFAKLSRIAVRVAKWQKQQFENNRLEHCDSITEEQYNLEVGFIDSHIDKYNRIPTFLDAIEYGMEKMKEEMMNGAVEATVTDIRTYKHENEVDFTIMLDKGIIPYETEEELKLIIIKED